MKSSLKILFMTLTCMALIALSLGAALAGPPVVTPGADPSAVLLGGVRYRELATGNDSEVFLGVPDLGDVTHRSESDLTWGASNTITFNYNAPLDKLTTSVNNGSTDWTLEYRNFSDQVRDLAFGGNQALADEALGTLNYMQVDIRLQEGSPAQVSLEDVTLNTSSLGSFSGVNHSWVSWQVNGADLSAGFTLSGTLNLTNVSSPSADLNFVEIAFGNVNQDTFAPTVSNVAAAPNPQTGGGTVTLTATVDDTSSGGSIIQSAQYRVGTGAWTPMNAADGSFDSTSEAVTALLAAASVDGDYSLCVRGTDSASNTSPEQCTTLKVDSLAPQTAAVQVNPAKTGGGASVDLTATVDDSATGNSNLQSAEYSTNGVDWSPMPAGDGSFDSPTEAVSAAFLSPPESGDVEVCVRGTDVAGNTGTATCTMLVVDADGPAASAVVLDPNPADQGTTVTVTADLDDSTTGNSNTASAEVQVAGGAWSAMLPADGSFDSPMEQVRGQFLAPTSTSPLAVCVRGTDEFGNPGAATCAQLEINAPAGPPPLYLPIAVKTYSTP